MADNEFQILGNSADSYAGSLFKSLESFPGQSRMMPSLLPAATEVARSRTQVVKVARQVERSNAHIRAGIHRKADMVTGPKLAVDPTPDWETLGVTDRAKQKKIRRAFKRVFNNWAYDSRFLQDGEGHGHFGTLMWMAFRNVVGPDGECFLAVQYEEERAQAYRHKWATFVTVIDPDRVETPPEYAVNPRVRDGKVFDKWNRPIGFFARRKHPNDSARDLEDMQFELVRREMPNGRPVGIHWFPKIRAGQIRGLTELITILRQSNMLDQFDDAYLGSAIINQTLATWIQTELSPKAAANMVAPATDLLGYDPWELFEKKVDYYQGVKMRVGGHRLPTLPPGDEIKMTSVNRAVQDPSDFRNGFLREFASALAISFEQLASNFSDANYSGARAALLEVWREVGKMREQFCSSVASLIYRAVLEEAMKKNYFKGLLAGLPGFDDETAAWCECNWVGPQMPVIDPEKDARALKETLNMKVESHTGAIAARGGDVDEVFDQIEEDREEADRRGFSLEMKDDVAVAQADAAALAAEQSASAAAEDERKPKPKKSRSANPDGDGDGVVDEKDAK